MPTSSSDLRDPRATARTARLAVAAGLLAAAAILALPAPADARRQRKPDPEMVYAPTAPVPMAPPPVADGAIYHASWGYAPLTSGTRASRVGDVLTVVLIEKTQALKSNSATTTRNGSIQVTPPPTGPLSLLKKTDLGMGSNDAFNGKGDAAQSNSLTGEISVTVAEIYPNGTMLVRGEKQLTLNRGDEQIRISGIVRPADIDFDNRVPSTRVADARITYAGTGAIARASQQGWLGRFFTRVSPF